MASELVRGNSETLAVDVVERQSPRSHPKSPPQAVKTKLKHSRSDDYAHIKVQSSPTQHSSPGRRPRYRESNSSDAGLSVWSSFEDAPLSSADIPSFGDYVACKFLGIPLKSKPLCLMAATSTYKALACLGHMYLLKDIHMIHEGFKQLGLEKVVRLYEATKQEVSKRGTDDSPRVSRAVSMGLYREVHERNHCHGEQNRRRHSESLSHSVRDMVTKHSQEMVRRMVVDTMKELEATAFEYFSYNWGCMHFLARLNATAMMEAGEVYPSKALQEALKKGPGQILRREGSRLSITGPSGSSSSLESEAFASLQLASPSMNSIFAADHGLLSDKWRARAQANWQRGRQAAARKITMDMLGQTRKSKTLKEVFGSLKKSGTKSCSEVFQSSLSQSSNPQRQPVLLLLGGGMAAGKSTVRDIIGKSDFWSKVAPDAVVVEADALKNQESFQKKLQKLSSAEEELVRFAHDYATQAAEAILVAAINEQKDVIFDGTMTWPPFVEQTIAMVRDHDRAYVCGPGYHPATEGTPGVERYWDPLPEAEQKSFLEKNPKRVPYRIELVGVTCDPGLAVARGLWRYLTCGRAVPINAQLRSHLLFAENFERYSTLVDSATLYFTGSALTVFNKGHVDTSPQVIAHCSSATKWEQLMNEKRFNIFKGYRRINIDASSRAALYVSDGHDRNSPTSVLPCPTAEEYHAKGAGMCHQASMTMAPASKRERRQALRVAFSELEEHVKPSPDESGSDQEKRPSRLVTRRSTDISRTAYWADDRRDWRSVSPPPPLPAAAKDVLNQSDAEGGRVRSLTSGGEVTPRAEDPAS